MTNTCCFAGRLTKDPELKTTTNGISVCSFSLAVDRRKSQDGTRKADFLDFVAWRKTAEMVCQYFHKGDQMIVVSRAEKREYTAKDGSKRYITEFVVDDFSFGAKAANNGGNYGGSNSVQDYGLPQEDSFQELEEDDGELPFES